MLWTGPVLEPEVASSCGVHTDVLMDVPMGVPMIRAWPNAPGSRVISEHTQRERERERLYV